MLVLSQPDYKSYRQEREKARLIQEIVNNQIPEIDKKIQQNLNDIQLYAERGKLYVKIYRVSQGYIPKAYELKQPLTIELILKKAIEDFDKVIRSKPTAEVLSLRGEMHSVCWLNDLAVDWDGELYKFTNPEWINIERQIPVRVREKKISLLGRLIKNKNFVNAKQDFETALSLSIDSVLTEDIKENLGFLILARANFFYEAFSSEKDILNETNPFNYSILDDVNQGILLIESNRLEKLNERTNTLRTIFFPHFRQEDSSPLNSESKKLALFLRANIILDSGDKIEALKVFNEIEKLVNDKNLHTIDYDFYFIRIRVNTELKNFDLAIIDATKVLGYNFMGVGSYEIRGDAFLGKGDFQAAVADYTTQLSSNNYHRNTFYKRGIAYLKMNDFRNAIADFTRFLSFSGDFNGFKSRASAYRQIGDEKSALADEKKAEDEIKSDNYRLNIREIYGKVVLNESNPKGIESSTIEIFYTDGQKITYSDFLDENLHFDLELLKQPLYFVIKFNKIKNGVRVRYYGKSKDFDPNERVFGPIIIKLNRLK
jgi:tetratricopeptide (TPR) repeat protein